MCRGLQILSAPGLIYIFASALCGMAGQWTLSVSYRTLDASSGSVISASRIPIALIVGAIALGEAFAWQPWLGAALILASNVLLALHSSHKSSQKTALHTDASV